MKAIFLFRKVNNKKETDVPSSALLRMSKMFGTDVDYLLIGASGVLGEKGA